MTLVELSSFARAVAFTWQKMVHPPDFSTLIYIASAFGAVLVGQVIVWSYPQANVYTALIAIAIGLIADGITLQVIFFVEGVASGRIPSSSALIGVSLVGLHSCSGCHACIPGVQVIVHSTTLSLLDWIVDSSSRDCSVWKGGRCKCCSWHCFQVGSGSQSHSFSLPLSIPE